MIKLGCPKSGVASVRRPKPPETKINSKYIATDRTSRLGIRLHRRRVNNKPKYEKNPTKRKAIGALCPCVFRCLTLTEHCSRAVESAPSTADSYLYPRRENFKTLRCSFPAPLQGWAVLSRVPIPGDCFGLASDADVTLIVTGFPVYPCFVQYVKVRFFVNRWGIEPRPLWGLALYSDLPFSCPFPRL